MLIYKQTIVRLSSECSNSSLCLHHFRQFADVLQDTNVLYPHSSSFKTYSVVLLVQASHSSHPSSNQSIESTAGRSTFIVVCHIITWKWFWLKFSLKASSVRGRICYCGVVFLALHVFGYTVLFCFGYVSYQIYLQIS